MLLKIIAICGMFAALCGMVVCQLRLFAKQRKQDTDDGSGRADDRGNHPGVFDNPTVYFIIFEFLYITMQLHLAVFPGG